MYNVPIPSVENDQVLLYLKNTGQINVWETVRKGKVTTTRPTYKELIEEVKIGDKWRRKWDTDSCHGSCCYASSGTAVNKELACVVSSVDL